MRSNIIIHLSKIMNYACGIIEIEGTDRRKFITPQKAALNDEAAMNYVLNEIFVGANKIRMNNVGNITIVCDAGTFSNPNYAVSTYHDIEKKMSNTWANGETYSLTFRVESRDSKDRWQKTARKTARSKWMTLSR